MNKFIFSIFAVIFSTSALSMEHVSRCTRFSPEGQCEVEKLENIPVQCKGTEVLNQFKLRRARIDGQATGQFKYDFQCISGFISSPDIRVTEWNDVEHSSTIYLDRHSVACKPHEGLSSFKLVTRNNAHKKEIRYEYTCRDAELTGVTEYETAWDDDGSGQSIYLDRHNIACPSDQVLNAFRLVRSSDETRYKYVYTCGQPNVSSIEKRVLSALEAYDATALKPLLDELFATIRLAVHTSNEGRAVKYVNSLKEVLKSVELAAFTLTFHEIAKETLASLFRMILETSESENSDLDFQRRLVDHLLSVPKELTSGTLLLESLKLSLSNQLRLNNSGLIDAHLDLNRYLLTVLEKIQPAKNPAKEHRKAENHKRLFTAETKLLEAFSTGDLKSAASLLKVNRASPNIVSPLHDLSGEPIVLSRAIMRHRYGRLFDPYVALEMLVKANVDLTQDDEAALLDANVWVGATRLRYFVKRKTFDFVDELVAGIHRAISEADLKTTLKGVSLLKTVFDVHCSGKTPTPQCHYALETGRWFEVTFELIRGLMLETTLGVEFEKFRKQVLFELLKIPAKFNSRACILKTLSLAQENLTQKAWTPKNQKGEPLTFQVDESAIQALRKISVILAQWLINNP